VSLSVCCPTGDPGPRVHAALAPLRGVADEIVVAADSRTPPADLAWYAAVADRLYTFEFTWVDRIYAWLHAQCRSEWILMIEGDECASPALIADLDEHTRQRDYEQVIVPRRWLYPDPEHWLDESPWWPDLSHRLVRNSGALFFDGRQHSDPLRVDPAKVVDTPIYHLAVLKPLAQRQAKIDRYNGNISGMTIGGVRDVNATFYLPEQSSGRRPVPVPESDRDAVQAWVAGTPGEPPSPRSRPQHVPLSETDRWFGAREFAAEGYHAQLEVAERDLTLWASEQRRLLIRVRNTGGETWPYGLDRPPYIHLAVERRRPKDGGWVTQPEVTPLPHTLRPGADALVPVTIIAPDVPGEYELKVDLRHAGHRWFGTPAQFTVVVVDDQGTRPAPPRRWLRRRTSRRTGASG
jgi:hypothetical protein